MSEAAEFASPFRHVLVTFDHLVWTDQGCEELLDTAALQAMGEPEGADCTVHGNQLLVRPGSKMAAPSGGVELTLAENSAIVRLGSGGGELAGRAAGSVVVNFTQALAEPPRLSLVGPSVVCASAGSRATFRALPLQEMGRPLTYSWNVTLETETSLPQATTLAVWQGINDVISRDETQATDTVSAYTIDSSKLVAGDFSYQVFVKAQAWTGASRIESRTFRVSDTGLSVAVSGNDRIARGGLYTYRAAASSCDQQGEDAQPAGLKYSWRLPGVSASHMDGLNSRTLRLDTSELAWQTEYRLTCVVTEPRSGEVFTDTLRLKPVGGGVRARLPTEQRAVQPTQPVYIDGGRSADLSGRPGRLSYIWSCQMADSGAGCFVGDPRQPPLQRLEQRLGQSAVSGPTLRVPAGLLAAEQRYRLALRVEKGEDVDTAYMEVYVNSQSTPKLWIERQQDVFDPFQPIFVSAQVSTDWSVSVVWDTDFPLPLEIMNSASFRPTLVSAGARRRSFDLVLPALETPGGEDGCALCGKVLRFVLRADMETSDSLVFSAEVDITMMDAPLLGELKVSDGEGLMTSLDATEGWTSPSDTLQLSYEFGFVDRDGLRAAMATVASDVPKADILLPRDASQVYVRVCPVGGVCLTIDGDVTPKQDIVTDAQGERELGERLVEVSELGRPEEVLAWSVAVMDRLSPEKGSDADGLPAIVHFTVQRALAHVTDRLRAAANSENMKEKTRAVDQTMTALELLQQLASTLPALPQFDLSAQRSTLHELVGATLLPPTDQTEEAFQPPVQTAPQPQPPQLLPARGPVSLPALNSRRSRRSLRRYKRAASTTSAAQPVDALKALRLLRSAESSSKPAALLSTVRSLLGGLCAGLPSTNSQPVAVLGDRLELQAARRQLDVTAWWPLVEGGEASNGTLLRASGDWRSWKWECGTDPEMEVAILCRDMCVTSWVTQEDLLIASSDRLQDDVTPRRTAVYNVGLLHPTTLKPQYSEEKLNSPFIVRITVNSSMELPEGRMLECRSWQKETWSASGCDSGPVSGGRLPCRCTRLGAVAAFEVDAPEPTTTPPPTTTAPTTETTTEPTAGLTQLKNITIRIDADYEAVVGDNKEEFQSLMVKQVADNLNISEEAIVYANIKPGSIILDLTIETSSTFNQRTKTTAQDPLHVLTQLVQSGQLELTDLQGNRLVIPRDGLDGVKVDPVKEKENTRTAVIIGAVIAVIVVLCIIGVIVAVVIKNKKRSKVGSMTSSTDRSQQNTYKSFQFEHVMDGTAASLEKYKSSRGMDDSDRWVERACEVPHSRHAAYMSN